MRSVAILGGGIAGLSCASQLLTRHKQKNIDEYDLDVTVFDTGRLRPGGRASSRLPGDKSAAAKSASTPAKKGGNDVDRSSRRACDDATSNNSDSNTNSFTSEIPSNILLALQPNNSNDRIITNLGPVDHAAQVLNIPSNVFTDDGDSNEFQSQLQKWLDEGVVETFPEGSVCELLSNDNTNLKLQPLEGDMYYGKGGMGSIPLAMREYCLSFNGLGEEYTGQTFRICQDVWVSPSNGVNYIGDGNGDTSNSNSNNDEVQWELRAGSKSLGKYHNLVIAHNGKCADRIMSRTPAKAFHSLLRTKFAPYVPEWGGREMTLNSIYSLVFAIKTSGGESSPITKALKVAPSSSTDIFTLIIKNQPNLRLLSSNTLKHHHAQNSNSESTIEVYTLLSSPKFGKKNKGPQENLPVDLSQKVTMDMLQSLENALSIDEGGIVDSVVDLKLQLWGAAVPQNVWTSKRDGSSVDGFVFDSRFGVGAAGDWILDPSIAGAWESGRRLADWMLSQRGRSVGLPIRDAPFSDKTGRFVASRAALEAGFGSIHSPNATFEFPSSSAESTRSNNNRSNGSPRSGSRQQGPRHRNNTKV